MKHYYYIIEKKKYQSELVSLTSDFDKHQKRLDEMIKEGRTIDNVGSIDVDD